MLSTTTTTKQSVDKQSIILLEDIDAAFPQRDDSSTAAEEQENSSITAMPSISNRLNVNNNSLSSDVTFSGLLNCLDGVSSRFVVLLIMLFTTIL